MVIGLDCAEPDLVFGRWLEDLPNIRRVLEAGVYGPLRSATPPITVPAWMSMMTGRDPGELGIYGFSKREPASYTSTPVTSGDVRAPTLWDVLGSEGKHSIVIGVPPSYPPKPVRGELIGCFLTPSTQEGFTYPAALREEIEGLVGPYRADVDSYRTQDKQGLLAQIYEMTEKRFTVARHLLGTRPWDFFVLVEMGIDRIHHGFWQYMDPGHVLHEPGTPFAGAVHDYYQYVDRQVGELLAFADRETLVLVVSDHGAKPMDGGIGLNEWLIEKGYLVLKRYPRGPTPLNELDVDWSHTRAWGEGGYYGRIFLNVQGRERQGALPPTEYEPFRARLAEELAALGDDRGNPIGTKVLKPQEVYREVRNTAPDLLVFFGDLAFRAVGTVGHGRVHLRENDTGPDGANHDWEGIFIMADGRDLSRGGRRISEPLTGLEIPDVFPTILHHFRIPPSPALRGRAVAGRRKGFG